MKDKVKIIIPVVLIIILGALAIYFLLIAGNGSKASSLKIESQADLTELVDNIYEKAQPEVRSLFTNELDLSDKDAVSYAIGLQDVDKLEYIVVSEPMMTSVAYSLILAKVKDGVDVNAFTKELFESIDPRKWICVAAEKVYATSSGDVVCLVMSSEENAKKVYDAFKEIAGSNNKEYEKDGEAMEDFDDFGDDTNISFPDADEGSVEIY